MARKRTPPTVFKNKHRQRNGAIFSDKYYSFKVQINGKRKTISTSHTSKRKAQDEVNSIFNSEVKFAKLIKDYFIESNVNNESSPVDIVKMDTVLESLKGQGWLNWETHPKRVDSKKQGKNYGSRQAKKISYAFNHMFLETSKYNWFSGKRLETISRKDAQQLADELWLHRTSRGVRCEGNAELREVIGNYKMNLVALKCFFTYCFDVLSIIDSNPFNGIRIPTSNSQEMKPFFSKLHLQKMFDIDWLQTLSNDKKWDKFIHSSVFKAYKFTALTGMRSGEVRALKWKQFRNGKILKIDRAFKENTTREEDIDFPKWNKVRTIVLSDSAHKIIHDGNDHGGEEYVFMNSVGNAIDASSWSKKFSYFMEELQGKLFFSDDHFTPHSFRGTLNTLLIGESSVSPVYIRQYLGWSDSQPLSVVQERHYTGRSIENTLLVAEAIQKLFTGEPLKWEMITDEENQRFAFEINNWEYTISQLNDSGNMNNAIETLSSIKNIIFKEVNNHFLYCDELPINEKDKILEHCKSVIASEFTGIDSLDEAFPQWFKKYLSGRVGQMNSRVGYGIQLLLDFLVKQKKQEAHL